MAGKTLIHNSPLGALEINGLAKRVEPGEPFTVPDATAKDLLKQSDLFTLAPTTKGESK